MKADVVVKAHESLFPRLARKNSNSALGRKEFPQQRSSSQESPTKNPGFAGTVCDRPRVSAAVYFVCSRLAMAQE